MSALTVRQLRDYLNTLTDDADLDGPCVMPIKTEMEHMFAFEEVCPAVTEMVTLGPAPKFMPDARDSEGDKEIRALLIAPHSFHDEIDEDGDDTEKQKILN